MPSASELTESERLARRAGRACGERVSPAPEVEPGPEPAVIEVAYGWCLLSPADDAEWALLLGPADALDDADEEPVPA